MIPARDCERSRSPLSTPHICSRALFLFHLAFLLISSLCSPASKNLCSLSLHVLRCRFRDHRSPSLSIGRRVKGIKALSGRARRGTFVAISGLCAPLSRPEIQALLFLLASHLEKGRKGGSLLGRSAHRWPFAVPVMITGLSVSGAADSFSRGGLQPRFGRPIAV